MSREQVRISAKTLGEVALHDFCPRCFWIRLHLRNRLPFQIFPGIFSSIDSFNKRIVHSWFDKHKCQPPWLAGLGVLTGYVEPPHFSKFNLVDAENNILLTGAPDGILVRQDGSHVIVDYKTAKYTSTQDNLLPMYEVQLNAYARIGNSRGLAPVSGLALVYMEPVTDDAAAQRDDAHRDEGFVMNFTAHVHVVEMHTERIQPLLREARQIFDRRSPPAGRPGCQNCHLLDQMVSVAQVQSVPIDGESER